MSLFQLFLYNHVGQNGIGTSIGREQLGAVIPSPMGSARSSTHPPDLISPLKLGLRAPFWLYFGKETLDVFFITKPVGLAGENMSC